MTLEYLTLGDCLLLIKKGRRYVYGEGFYNSFISSYSSIIYSPLFLIEYKKLPNHKD